MDMISRVEAYVFELFKKELDPSLSYHNYNHTHSVVEASKEIGKAENLKERDLETVLIAAWFHDTGFVNTIQGHEAASAEIAEKFLVKEGYASDQIQEVKACILATKMPQSPSNLMEEVLCDADLSNLGKKSFNQRNELLKTEQENISGEKVPLEKWIDRDIAFLRGHKYFTRYGQLDFGPRKAKNLAGLKSQRRILEEGKHKDKKKLSVKERELQLKLDKAHKPDRGIETMFRVALRNHMALSAIADNKANIMLSINAIILSIGFSSLFPSLDKNPHLIFPSAVMSLVCLVTIIFSILATRPKITKGKFTRQDIENKRTNLLFFGNFYGMPLDDFKWGMEEMMKDKEFLYGSLTKDLYFLGVVLGKKYRILRTTYTVFMFGMILTVLAFGFAFLTYDWAAHGVY